MTAQFNKGDLVKLHEEVLERAGGAQQRYGVVLQVREWGMGKNNPGHSLFIYWAGDYGKFWTISGRVVKVASA